jgi:hypothetical protein
METRYKLELAQARTEGVALIRNPESRALFLTFTGNAQRLMMDPLRFFQRAGIARANILIFRDSSKRGYHYGVSSSYPNLESICDYVRTLLTGPLAHVTDTACIGTSSGGYPAIFCGLSLRLKSVWCFGARVVRSTYLRERDSAWRELKDRVSKRNEKNPRAGGGVSHEESLLVERELEKPEIFEALWKITEEPKEVLDPQALQVLREMKRSQSPLTRLHMYYSPRNDIDSAVMRIFKGLPNVREYLVKTPDLAPGAPFGDARVTHNVVKLLDEQDRLGDIFRDYLDAM